MEMLTKVKFTKEDEEIILSFKRVIKGISFLFGKNCEVVLHSFKNAKNPTIVAIENGHITGRKKGDSLAKPNLKHVEKIINLKKDINGPYVSKTTDGRILKSMTMVIKNSHHKSIGLLCINFDLSVPLGDFMNEFMIFSHPQTAKEKIEVFPQNAKQLINTDIVEITKTINSLRKVSPRKKTEMILRELYKRGIFEIKNGIDRVAEELDISRFTVYNYIRKFKKKEETTEAEKDMERR